ncbi:hypothetical protein D9Q98_007138 [Chlorella vulgaris]|uniref:Glutathione S-transferase 3, mitochondrial n=1 Tax=Chlorella vulgaris TaxID=3077 RepID=A0A9D4YUI4_CHLVU|nr:hypothetical protein D9Q98_007138 [Chlorella vulgaris]
MMTASLTTSTGIRLQPARRLSSPNRANRTIVRPLAALMPADYGWVMASVAYTAAVSQWQSIQVMKARKECGVPYPLMYATGEGEAANKFNCTQRGHQNMLETLPLQLAMQLLVGVLYPRGAAIQGAVWATCRIAYMRGYMTGDPKKRNPGAAICFFSFVGLLLTTAVLGVRTALGM